MEDLDLFSVYDNVTVTLSDYNSNNIGRDLDTFHAGGFINKTICEGAGGTPRSVSDNENVYDSPEAPWSLAYKNRQEKNTGGARAKLLLQGSNATTTDCAQCVPPLLRSIYDNHCLATNPHGNDVDGDHDIEDEEEEYSTIDDIHGQREFINYHDNQGVTYDRIYVSPDDPEDQLCSDPIKVIAGHSVYDNIGINTCSFIDDIIYDNLNMTVGADTNEKICTYTQDTAKKDHLNEFRLLKDTGLDEGRVEVGGLEEGLAGLEEIKGEDKRREEDVVHYVSAEGDDPGLRHEASSSGNTQFWAMRARTLGLENLMEKLQEMWHVKVG